eukprot:TRINITY_DN22888_c0_g1_i1.p1 TRINITY_DN22888_c0_g1~~TRINITY_DN22888_c0_g1_i1.p1  ORF type:complete len:424 (+),score=95.09 TRINITY_DN22888_c0_g1_i1:62-1273(+)
MFKNLLVVCKRWSNQVLTSSVLRSMIHVSEVELKRTNENYYEKLQSQCNPWEIFQKGIDSSLQNAIKIKHLKKLVIAHPAILAIKNDNIEIFRNIEFDNDWFRENCVCADTPSASVFHRLVENSSFNCLDHLLNEAYAEEKVEKVHKLLNIPLLGSKTTIFLEAFHKRAASPRFFQVVTEFLRKHLKISIYTLIISFVDGGTIDSESITTFFDYFKVDPNEIIEGHPIIFYPIATRNTIKMNYLLEHGAKLDVKNKFEVSPVHVAFSRGILIDLDKIKPILPSINQPTKIHGHKTLLDCLLIGLVLNPDLDLLHIIQELQLTPKDPVPINYFLSYFLAKFSGHTSLLDTLLSKISLAVPVHVEGDLVYRMDYLKKWWLTDSVPFSFQIPPAILQACEKQGLSF